MSRRYKIKSIKSKIQHSLLSKSVKDSIRLKNSGRDVFSSVLRGKCYGVFDASVCQKW